MALTVVNTEAAEGGPSQETIPVGSGYRQDVMAACKPPMLFPASTKVRPRSVDFSHSKQDRASSIVTRPSKGKSLTLRGIMRFAVRKDEHTEVFGNPEPLPPQFRSHLLWRSARAVKRRFQNLHAHCNCNEIKSRAAAWLAVLAVRLTSVVTPSLARGYDRKYRRRRKPCSPVPAKITERKGQP